LEREAHSVLHVTGVQDLGTTAQLSLDHRGVASYQDQGACRTLHDWDQGSKVRSLAVTARNEDSPR
jgi:hypothetical protein